MDIRLSKMCRSAKQNQVQGHLGPSTEGGSLRRHKCAPASQGWWHRELPGFTLSYPHGTCTETCPMWQQAGWPWGQSLPCLRILAQVCCHSSEPNWDSASTMLSQQLWRRTEWKGKGTQLPITTAATTLMGRSREGATKHDGDNTTALVSLKDTVPTNEEDDEVDADDHSWRWWAPVRHNAIIHHSIPIFACQNLRSQNLDQPAGGPTRPRCSPRAPGSCLNLV